MTNYREILSRLRLAFPQPVSDRVHDSYFVHSIMRAIDQLDALKTEIPLLGVAPPNDYEAAEKRRLRDEPETIEEVTAETVDYLRGMQIFGHPCSQQNVTPPTSIPSVIGVLLASVYNPNVGWDEYSRRVALAEVQTTAIAADLVGYDPERAGGVFTFGGTGTSLYGVKLGLEKAWPGTMRSGIQGDALIFASDVSHYCRLNIAGWLGLGSHSVVVIPSLADNAIDLRVLGERARETLRQGKKIAAFIATLGSTDAFGLDDLEAIVALRDRLVEEFQLPYRPQVHADAVIGWAWSTFRGYAWDENDLGFRPRTVRALAGIDRKVRHLYLADSIGIDFHKTGYCPYIASLFLVKERDDFKLLARTPETMPYLYHSGEYTPGFFTLETSRSGGGVLAALANLRLFGKRGWQAVLGHIVEMAQILREHLDGHESTTVLNRQNFGPVTLFRVYPDGVDTFTVQEREFKDPAYREALHRHNEYNRRIGKYLHKEALAGRGVMISSTECYRHTDYGEPIVALKSYILSPFVDEENVQVLIDKILEARGQVELPDPASRAP
jgi:glutamate/tyrosine decarboxylase-like PLP-dependent enzyme